MYNLISAELYKIFKSMTIKISFAITTICAVFMWSIAYNIGRGSFQSSMSGIGFLFGDMDVMSIMGGVLAGVYICGDFDNNTIHDAIASGCSRGSVVVSKAAAFFCTAAFLLLPYAVITSIALGTGSKFSVGSSAIGFLNLLTSDGAAAGIGKLFLVSLTLSIVYAAQLSLCVFLGFLLKKPVLVVGIYYSFSILCGQLGNLAKNSELLNNIFSCTPYGGKHSFITLSSGAGDIVKALAVSFIFIILMLLATHLAFRKSEIK